MIADQVVDHVVTLVGLGEIFFRIIDHVIGADRSNQIDISSATDSRDFGAERFGDLDGESSNAAGSAVDQHFLSGLNVPLIAQTLQRRQPGNANRAGLLERDVARFQHNRTVGLDANVLSNRAVLRAEDFIARFEVGYVFSNSFDDASEVSPKTCVLWFAQTA